MKDPDNPKRWVIDEESAVVRHIFQMKLDGYGIGETATLLARDRELDKLFERLYEDNVSGKVTDERFSTMSKRYGQEQGENSAKIKAIKRVLKENGCQLMTTDLFLEIVHQYTDVRKLTQRMIAELIDHIEVHHAEKISGRTTQKLTIYYNCIGAFTVPERKDIPDVDVSTKTRKGGTKRSC